MSADSIDTYIDRIIDAKNSSADMKKVFSELTSEIINQKIASGELTAEDEKLLAVWLKSIGVANADSVAHEALVYDKDVVANAERKLSSATESTIGSVYKEISAMMSEQGTTQATKQKLFELALQKMRVNNAEIRTAGDIQNLINLAKQAGATTEYLKNLEKAKSLVASAGQYDQAAKTATDPRGGSAAASFARQQRETAQHLIDSYDYNTDYNIDYNGNASNGGSSGGSSGSDKRLEAWKNLVNEKKHLVEMDKMTQEEYYEWLSSAYKSHLSDASKYSDELMSIEEELYGWEKERIQSNIDDRVAVLDNQKAQGLISEEEYFKELDKIYQDGYDELKWASEEGGLYGVDTTERLNAETEFLEKVK